MIAFIYLAIPWVLAGLGSFVVLRLNVSYNMDNFDKVLDSVITFSSIILGFLAALLGILITIRNSPIMREIHKEKQDGIIKYYFFESITCGFFVVITSTILHLAIEITNGLVQTLYIIWTFLVILFTLSSYRIITTLMRLLFKVDVGEERLPKQELNKPEEFVNNIPTKSNDEKTRIPGQELFTIDKED